jgi:hypothetical protein
VSRAVDASSPVFSLEVTIMDFPNALFGTLRAHYMLLFGTAGAIGLVAGFIGAWLGSWLGGRSGANAALRRALVDAGPNLDALQRMPEIVAGIDALAIEVERLGESQRFVAKALASRVDSPAHVAAPSPVKSLERRPGHVTPH